MIIGANSYGSVASVEALVKKYAGSGFTPSTNPTLTQVVGFIDNISGIANTLLAHEGFTIPVSQASAKLALDEFVVEIAAALCESANSSGRFFSEKAADEGTFNLIRKEAEAFIVQHAQGLEDLGAARSRHLATAWLGTKPIATT